MATQMGIDMIKQAGDNIISSLGFTARENYESVKSGRSGIARHERWGLPEPFMASLIDRERLNDSFASLRHCANDYTPFEKAAILSVSDAAATRIDLSDPRVLFLLSTTKGNVHLLDENETRPHPDAVYLWYSAQRIAGYFGNRNTPTVVSNACISGACAQIEAMRLLEAGLYDCAVVTGVDMLSKFIVSGFQSFKALSHDVCRPFDAAHEGLNLGEAASTIIYIRTDETDTGGVTLARGAVCNDANHISGPSRTGEGCFLALQSITKDLDTDKIAFINAHGTATVYNDRMEAVAIARAGLDGTPVNGLKGHFGHTLGAAGVLESVISSYASADRTILPVQGFVAGETGSTLRIADRIAGTDKPYFIKMLSGFGGCNAALLFRSPTAETREDNPPIRIHTHTHESENSLPPLYIYKHCRIAGGRAATDGKTVFAGTETGNGKFLTALYRAMETDYPKFFKMDNLSKLGFLASELILRDDAVRFTPRRDEAVVCFNRSSSLDTDAAYQATIRHEDAFFPSPSVFVYTLPNIVSAEIAIRNKIYGETSFYVCPHFDAGRIATTVGHVFRNKSLRRALVAWIEYFEGRCDAMMCLVGHTPPDDALQGIPFSEDMLDKIYHITKSK
ncbi:MAG: 3-oxoacyl-ACP synthase [Tannerella sp.]|jgi:3-oxoacyl-[acyl-carrier-protein] synthase-1|nr:3-oxoacyl-ACP synthase [Tannerella sp.]